jgi:hypothetical protein
MHPQPDAIAQDLSHLEKLSLLKTVFLLNRIEIYF